MEIVRVGVFRPSGVIAVDMPSWSLLMANDCVGRALGGSPFGGINVFRACSTFGQFENSHRFCLGDLTFWSDWNQCSVVLIV